jgi:hypothetical protein
VAEDEPVTTRALWPYSNRAALLAAPVIWVVFGAMLIGTRGYLGWPDPASMKWVVPIVLGVGLVPIVLCIIDYAASQGAVLGFRGLTIDFSRTEIRRGAVELPENIGRPGPVIPDSTAMEIIATLEAATVNPIVRLDIKAGNAWWVTRLFALSAGAVRAGSPRVLVFVGVKQEEEGVYLGWARPAALVRALVADSRPRGPANVTYGTVYRKAERLTKQVSTFLKPRCEPAAPPPDTPPPAGFPPPLEIQRYINRDAALVGGRGVKYAELGEAAFEQVLLDQLGAYRLEDPPDRLTLGRLEELFAHCLYRDVVDLEWAKDRQLTAFLESRAPYVALVRRSKYEGLVERAEVERLIIRRLFRGTSARPKSQSAGW